MSLRLNKIIRMAESHLKAGEFSQAEELFRDILHKFPKNKKAIAGYLKIRAGITDKDSSHSEPPHDQLQVLVNLFNNNLWEEVISKVNPLISVFPKAKMLHNLKGASHAALNHYDIAIESYDKAIKIDPSYIDALVNRGSAFQEKGELDEAIFCFQKTLTLKPNHPFAYFNMGNALHGKGELDAAVESYQNALKIRPNYAETYFNMGNIFNSKGEFHAATNNYKQVLKIEPDHVDAHYNMGISLKNSGQLDAAIDSFKQAIEIRPNYADAHINLGFLLEGQREFDAAIESYKKAIEIRPDYAEAYNNIGSVLNKKGELFAALDCYKRALEIYPENEAIFSQKLYQQAQMCDWNGIEQDRGKISRLGITEGHIDPFGILSLEDAPERHRIRSEIYASNKYANIASPVEKQRSPETKRLRVGYFSANFQKHPVAYLIAKVIEIHNRDRFEVYGYSVGATKEDEVRRRLAKGFDFFKDVRNMTDKNIASLARQDKIDIAVDLSGYTEYSDPGIFAYRAAPIQISYLGYPGTMGANFIDYIIADENLIPTESQRYYSEKPIYLPHHYQAQDNTIPISNKTPTRSELGLPEKGFVFCAINNNYKITSSEFDIWMRLLQKVEGSVLWLLETNKWAKGNLLKAANERGVTSEQIIFAQKAPHEEYLAQFRQADLYLDTFIYNAGATASNALWAGLPVLTKLGKGYTARMAGSLLSSIGLPELITTHETEYEALALQLATNPEQLDSIKNKLTLNRLSKPLFDTELFIKHLEDAYQKVHQRYLDEKQPAPIYVPA